MRKITEMAAQAFLSGKSFSLDNTKVTTDGSFVRMFLFGNEISFYRKDRPKKIFVTMAGFPSATTRERLNGIAFLSINKMPFYQKKGKQFLSDIHIDPNQTYLISDAV